MSLRTIPSRANGFSLIELTVALVIISIMLTMGVTAFTVQLQNAAHSSTLKKQEIIKEALSMYLGKYRRLPCPDLPGAAANVSGRGDDNRATAENVTTTCAAAVGVVPYIDLGLSRDTVTDGWENLITYAVTIAAADTADWSRSSAFSAGKAGNLSALSRSPATNAATTDLTAPEKAVVILVSHGPNGLGAWTIQATQNIQPAAGTDEANNTDGDTTFIVREPTTTDIAVYGAFDDKVHFIKASELIAPLVKEGSVKSAEGEKSETRKIIADTTDAIIGASLANSALPDPATSVMPNDIWGTPLLYTRVFATQIYTNTPPGVAFRVKSNGPNKVAEAPGDDIEVTTSIDSLKPYLNRASTLVAAPVIPPVTP